MVETMKQSPLIDDASSHSRTFRSVFFLLFFSIVFVTTTNAQPQVMHRRLWPWPTWKPFPMIHPRPWPRDSPEPAPSPNPCPPPPPKPQPKPPPSSTPCPPPKPPPPAPEPCPPPKPPSLAPCPPPSPEPQPKPAPRPEPCPPTPPKPQPKPYPAPDAGPEPSPCPPKPPKPMPPPSPKPPKPEKKDIPAVFFFGDSIFDTGNNNDRKKAKMKSNFRPYGINFKDGVATGRFSNGKVSSDYIAKYMGVKKIVPAYLDKKMKPEDLLTGVSFASGGAGYLPKTSKSTKAIPMLEQLTNFQDYIENVNKLVKEENLSSNSYKANKMISKGVAVVSGGGNDLINTFFGDGAQRLKKDIDSFTTMMADSAASFVLQLYEYGAKRIGVVGLPPLGCAPLERKKRKKKCNKKLNYASQLFNSKLLIIMGQLSKSLQNSTLVYMDVYTIMSQMIETPKNYGFEEIRKPCCKTGSLFRKGVLCKKQTSKICSNTSSYLFWDGIHPTKRALKIINKVLVKEYIPLLSKK